MNAGGWIIVIFMIILILSYFYVSNPWSDAKAETTTAMVGGAYLLRKFMKHKKSHKKRK
jgi:hypothetical protein